MNDNQLWVVVVAGAGLNWWCFHLDSLTDWSCPGSSRQQSAHLRFSVGGWKFSWVNTQLCHCGCNHQHRPSHSHHECCRDYFLHKLQSLKITTKKTSNISKAFILFSTRFVCRLTMISLTVSIKKKSNDFNICFWLNTVSDGGVLLKGWA